jgi:hypothetical protein
MSRLRFALIVRAPGESEGNAMSKTPKIVEEVEEVVETVRDKIIAAINESGLNVQLKHAENLAHRIAVKLGLASDEPNSETIPGWTSGGPIGGASGGDSNDTLNVDEEVQPEA